MDASWLPAAAQDMMRRRMLENQQAADYMQQSAMDRYKQMMPPQQVRGPIEAIKDAFMLRRDEQGAPQAPGIGDYLRAALMAIPGTGRPTATIPNRPMFQANNYMEPPVAANAVPAHEMTRLQRQLGRMMPITPENEAAATAVRAQIRKLDEIHDATYWGRAPAPKPNPLTTDLDQLYGAPSPAEKARLLGIRVIDPTK